MRRRTLWLVAVMAPGLCGCGGDDGRAVEPNGRQERVTAVDNSFSPGVLTVDAGTEVVWENQGRQEHNVIPSEGDTGWAIQADDLQPGESAGHVFTEPGTYRYYCSIHGNAAAGMTGEIAVR